MLKYNSFVFLSSGYSVATGNASKQHILNQQKDIDFDEWLTLDKQLCNLYTQINRYWIRFVIYSLFYNNLPDEAVAYFEKYVSVTGSTVELSAICRTLVNEQIDIELDLLYCIGQINENIVSNVLASVMDHPGFFRVRPTVFECVFPFFKKEQTFACLCQGATNIDNAANLIFDVFDEQNEFIPTETLRKNIAKIVVQGHDNPTNVFISGPSSGTYQSINESSMGRAISTVANLFPNIKPKKYNPVSLNDIITLESNDLVSPPEDLESLYCRAFPHHSDTIDYLYLKKLMQKLRSGISEAYVIDTVNLIQKIGYIPYADIAEFGYLYFDHVPSIHLNFWPTLALEWIQKDVRHWPDSKILEKITSEGCHIVPKSPRGENNNEWRISFSSAELTLSGTLNPFQRKCYLVGKVIYYLAIKRIDPDIFASYFIKTVMFKLLERQPSSYWENTSLIEVVQDLFKDLSACFERRVLTSFFIEDLNILDRIDHKILTYASMEAGAVARYPLAFLPENYEKKIELLKKAIVFGNGVRNWLITFYNWRGMLNLSYSNTMWRNEII